MICLKNIRKKYGRQVIFKGANLEINKAGLYLICADNGKGKSTLLNIIGGFTKYKGKCVNNYKYSMSYLFQNSYLIESLTVKEHLDLFDIDYTYLKKFYLEDKLEAYPSELSSGEKQRIGIIICLYSDSLLVLLDEPTSNLDNDNIEIVANEIKKIKNDKIILMISHDYKQFKGIIDSIINIDNYKLSCKGINDKSKVIEFTNEKRNNRIRFLNSYKTMYMIIFLFMLMISVLSYGAFYLTDRYEKDIKYSVDYNKFYLKKCEKFNSNGFIVSKCSNPNIDDIEQINIEYGYNYDGLLNYLFNREDLNVVNNKNVLLKEGKYPSKFNEVMADDSYKIGDTIELDANLLVESNNIDFYNKNMILKVVGIYNDLSFYNDNNIYFDYYLVEDFFKSEILINNNISLYEYYKSLDIENYKYLTFNKIEDSSVQTYGYKYEFYKGISDIIIKIKILVKNLIMATFILFIYYFYKVNRASLIKEQTSIGFLLANSFSSLKFIMTRVFFVSLKSLVILLILVSIFYCQSALYNLINLYLLLLIILSLQTWMFFSRKKIGELMREEVW